MKTLKITTLLLAIGLLIGSTSSCKYEEGPGISLRSKSARVAGDWILDKAISATGVETPGGAAYGTVTFEKDGNGKVTSPSGTATNFTWEFADSKESLEITLVNTTNKVKILRLAHKELWLENNDTSKEYYKAK